MSSIADQVVDRINQNYELDQDFVEEVRQYINEAVAQAGGGHHEDLKSSNGESEKPKKSRKPTAYACYLKAIYPELKDIPYKERMTEAGKRWKALSKEEQAKYSP